MKNAHKKKKSIHTQYRTEVSRLPGFCCQRALLAFDFCQTEKKTIKRSYTLLHIEQDFFFVCLYWYTADR